MKLVTVITVLLLVSVAGHAQLKGFSIGPFAEVGSPTGDFQTTNKMGYGIGVGGDIRFGKIGLLGSVGYMQFAGKTVNTEGTKMDYPTVKAFPVRLGLKYRLAKPFYAKLESGFAKFNGTDQSSAVIISPGIGVRILGVDIQGKYEIWKNKETYGFWGVKAGINF